jgi:DNA replication protein DnaC
MLRAMEGMTPEAIRALVERSVTAWACPACGDEVAILGAGKPLPPDLRCWDCIMGRKATADRQARLRRAAVPEAFRIPFESRDWPANANRQAGEECFDPDRWLAAGPWAAGLVGPSGTGKTMYAVELLARSVRPGLFIRCDRMVTAIMGGIGADQQVETYRAVTSAPFLVLDDLGWGALGRAIERVFEVLAARHEAGLKTVWTSNSSMRELNERNAPMARRLMLGPVLRLTDADLYKG